MPLNPYLKGGSDVPITDGGTGASTAAGARTNLDVLDEVAHDLLDHSGLTGVGDMYVAAHAVLDHAAIPHSYLNIGATSSASTSGQLAAGDGARELFWSASAGTLSISGTTAGLNMLLLGNADTSVDTPGLGFSPSASGGASLALNITGTNYSGTDQDQQGTSVGLAGGSAYQAANNSNSNFIGGGSVTLVGGDTNGNAVGGDVQFFGGRGSWNKNTSSTQGTGQGGAILFWTQTSAGSGTWTERWQVHALGHLLCGKRVATGGDVNGDNLYDIGSHDGGTTDSRPRTIYVGTSVEVGTSPGTTAQGDIVAGDGSSELSWDASAGRLGITGTGAQIYCAVSAGQSSGSVAAGDLYVASAGGSIANELFFDSSVGTLNIITQNSTNTVGASLYLNGLQDTLTPGTGLGTEIRWVLEASDGSQNAIGYDRMVWTDGLVSNRTSDRVFSVASNNTLQTELLRLRGSDLAIVGQGGIELGSAVVGSAEDGDILAGNATYTFLWDTSAGLLSLTGAGAGITTAGDVVVGGNLTVNGTTTTVDSELQTADNYVLLNSEYTADAAQTAGLVLNIDPAAASFSISDITSNVITVTTDPTSLGAGDFILIQDPADPSNAGIYEVLTATTGPNEITIDTTPAETFSGTSLANDATAQGTVVGVSLAVLRSSTAGIFQSAFGSAGGLTYNNMLDASTSTLNIAYTNGNTITTAASPGNVIVAGTQALQVTATGGLDVDTLIDFDGTTATFDASGAISLDAGAASNFTTTAGALTLDGNAGVNIAGNAAEIDLTTTGALDLNSGTFTLDCSTATITATDAISITSGTTDDNLTLATGNNGAGDSGNILIDVGTATGTAGDVSIAAANAVNLNLGASGTLIGFYGATAVAQSAAYTPTNVVTDRAYDADATSIAELADVVGTLIADLQATGLIG
jgi:hypothetical protein